MQASSSSSAAAVPEYPLPQRSPPSAFAARQAIALDFPALPDSCLALCSSLSGSELSGVERASRAWLAGCWPQPSGFCDPRLPFSCRVPCVFLRCSGALPGQPDQVRWTPTALVAAESGSVEIVEFSWPVLSPDQASYQCLAYCIMKRPSGFLLCVPEGFLPQEELDRGQAATEVDGIGPSLSGLSSRTGGVPDRGVEHSCRGRASAGHCGGPVQVASQLAPADFAAPSLYTFKDDNPAVFPRATDIIRQARDWIATVDVLAHDRSGYHTAMSTAEPVPGPKDKARAPKRPTVQQLATQQAKMMDLLSTLMNRLDSLQQPAAAAQEPGTLPAEAQPGLPPGNPLLQLCPPFRWFRRTLLPPRRPSNFSRRPISRRKRSAALA